MAESVDCGGRREQEIVERAIGFAATCEASERNRQNFLFESLISL
jgi:hypothetical protein